jgi:carboxymethylenebutenolidase
MAFITATQARDVNATVVYYGTSPTPLDLLKNVRGPVMAHYGEKDERVNKGIPDTEAAMKKYNKVYEYKIYPGAQHAFDNDTWPERYNAQASKEAWQRTMEFFKKQLKS